MIIFDRKVIPTTLDPVPRSMRCMPGVIALNSEEIAAIRRNSVEDQEVVLPIMAAAFADERADGGDTYVYKSRKVMRNSSKLGPSVRMSMLAAIQKK